MLELATVEDFEELKYEVVGYFKEHFEGRYWNRVMLDNFTFDMIIIENNASLIAMFLEKEVRDAIWDCDSLKSSELDGVAFGFLKEYWKDFKGELGVWSSNIYNILDSSL